MEVLGDDGAVSVELEEDVLAVVDVAADGLGAARGDDPLLDAPAEWIVGVFGKAAVREVDPREAILGAPGIVRDSRGVGLRRPVPVGVVRVEGAVSGGELVEGVDDVVARLLVGCPVAVRVVGVLLLAHGTPHDLDQLAPGIVGVVRAGLATRRHGASIVSVPEMTVVR